MKRTAFLFLKGCPYGLLWRIPIFLSVLLIPYSSTAQKWKDIRYEMTYGVGYSNYLGDLGGEKLKNAEWSLTRPAVQLGFRYKITQWLAVKSGLSYTQVGGDDKLSDDLIRNYRNLSFRSPVVELAVQLEPSIVREKMSNEHRIRGVKGQKGLLLHVYPFAGLAVFYFNPMAQVPETDPKGNPLDGAGKWIALRPLSTEGQELFGTRKKYSLVQIAILYGFGFKYGFNKKWSVAFEFGKRKTFTDYIDDVSSTYVDNEYIRLQKGEVAAAMADRSPRTDPVQTDAGQLRGNPTDKDSYFITTLSLNYKFNWERKKKISPKFFAKPLNR